MTGKKIAIIVALIGVVAITNTVQFILQGYDKEEIRNSYEQRLQVANATLEEIGEMVECYTVSLPVSETDPVAKTDLVPLELPAYCVNEGFIQDPNEALGKYYKTDINPGTPLVKDLLMDEPMDDTVRDIDIPLDNWPTGLKAGDYIDIRLVYPKGEDYIVLTHKRVYDINGSTLKLRLSEREIHFIGAAVIDNIMNSKYGSTLYATKYIHPGLQKPAEVYYNVPDNIMTVISNNPNIVDKVLDSSIPRSIIESATNISDPKEGETLGSGRAKYQAKLDQAREYFTQQGKTAPTEEEVPAGETDDSQIPDEDSILDEPADGVSDDSSTSVPPSQGTANKVGTTHSGDEESGANVNKQSSNSSTVTKAGQ